jgi:small subunit ribosomal protein S17
MPGLTKTLTGTVVSDKMDKTVVVLVEISKRHRLYHKILKRSKRFMAHDDRLEAKTGDLVRIAEMRPLSRHKRWRVIEIVQRREVAEVAPREIDAQYISMTREREEPPAPKAAGETEAAEGVAGQEAPAAEAPAEEAPGEEAAAEESTGESTDEEPDEQ